MIIIGLGMDKVIAKGKLKELQREGKCYLGVGLTKQWDTEYCAVTHTIPLERMNYWRIKWLEDCILVDICGQGVLYRGPNVTDEIIGYQQPQTRGGKMEDLFLENVGEALLKEHKTDNLTAFEVPNKHGYVVITYK